MADMVDRETPSASLNLNDLASNGSTSSSAAAAAVAQMAAAAPGPTRSVKRPRPVKSCIECRNRKLKCDRLCPCSQCQKSHRACRYAADGDVNNLSDGASDVETPERPPKKACLPVPNPEGTPKARERSLTVPALVLDDYGARLERLEKIVLMGSKSPSIQGSSSSHARPPPLPSTSVTIRGLTVKGGLRTRFFGQNSTRVLLNLVGTHFPCPFVRLD
jgi:hypothetical protein